MFLPSNGSSKAFVRLVQRAGDKHQSRRAGPRGMSHPRSSSWLSSVLTTTLLLVMFHPVALAEVAWEEDGWLRTSYAQERLALGDEFGCYGMPDLSWDNDPGAVADACRRYVTERLNASRWGPSPLSIYTPATLTMADHTKVASQGFPVHGDNTGLDDTAWHSFDDVPVDLWDWYNLGRRGGSLEKGMASLESLETAVEQGGLINLYWVGRINDATVRHDRDVVAYLDAEPDVWFTTWGEAWSSWSAKRCYEFTHEVEQVGNGSVLRFESLLTDACTAASEGLAWNVPLTWLIDTEGQVVEGVTSNGLSLPSIEHERRSMEGWWQQPDGVLVLSVVNGHPVDIHFAESDVSYDVLGQATFFNNRSAAVTVAGHQTTDLFTWSKRFLDATEIRFTWLLQPRLADGVHGWIPYAVLGVGFLTVVGMLGVLGREGIGPLANIGINHASVKSLSSGALERSLDADDASESDWRKGNG